MIKCFVEELRKLKESSKEAVENLDSFNKDYMHIKRGIEVELLNLIKTCNESKDSQLILVCGGVGDGKSHLISYLKKKYPHLFSNFKLHNDATESFEPQKTSIDTLNDVLKPFSDNYLNKESCTKLILAINLGALTNFIDSEYISQFSLLKQYVLDMGIIDLKIVEKQSNQLTHFHYINFSDYHIYCLTPEGPRSPYIKEILYKITSQDQSNPFYNSYIETCRNRCQIADSCPVKANYEYLTKDSVQDTLINILIESIIKYKLIISTRAFLNFIYDLIVCAYIDSLSTNELINKIQLIKFKDYIKYLLPYLLYDSGDRSNIFEALSYLDPLMNRTEEMDNLIITLITSEKIYTLFDQYVYIHDYPYLYRTIMNFEVLKNLLTEEKSLKIELLSFLLRYYKFSPKNEYFDLLDPVYEDYIRNLYYWNVGKRRCIRDLYSNIKEGIYKWNGENDVDHINVQIGKNQLKYKISQKLELQHYLNDLIERDSEFLEKFSSNLELKFKTKDSTEIFSIVVDYSLYNLLIQIGRGYRPNQKDKSNFVNFVTFINKIIYIGGQSKELIFEDQISDKLTKFKLTYSEDFDDYEFMEM